MNTSAKCDILKVTFLITYLLIVMAAIQAWSNPESKPLRHSQNHGMMISESKTTNYIDLK